MLMTPAATEALNDAPVDATVRATRVEGGVTPWSTLETRIASMSRPTLLVRQLTAQDEIDELRRS